VKKINKIGVFDSGAGGLSVVKSLLSQGLFEEIIYFGDTARVPYGIKDKNTIIRYGLEALEYFKNFDIDLLITACNTVSAHALPEMQQQCDWDVIGVVEPGVEALAQKSLAKEDSILIIGTKATVTSQAYQHRLSALGYNNLTAIPTGLFVSLVEEQILSGAILEETMKHYFKDLQPKAIILGCTHFPLLQEQIHNYFHNNVELIHSGDAIVTHLKSKYICQSGVKTKVRYFASENPDGLKQIAKLWLGDLYDTCTS
jgi:glutamate racemase